VLAFAAHPLIRYIQNQVRHHRRKSFREEYLDFLRKFNVVHDELYIFKLARD
jgi:hypothetical protein